MGYIEGVLHSIMNRKKQVMKIWLTIMAVAGLVTIIMALGDSLKAYQKAVNQKAFGKWFIMETSVNGKTSDELSAHPYLTGYGEVINVSGCYGADYTQNNYSFGYMDKAACDIASLSLKQGNMPQNNNEIAVEKDTLSKLGYSYELGQTITVYYYDKRGGYDNILSKKCSKEYKLVGIIENYASYWSGGEYVPTFLITKEEAESYGYIERRTFLYTLDENIHTHDYRQVYEGMKEQISTHSEYNSRVYDSESVGFDGITAYAAVFAAVIGMVAGFAVLLAYNRERAGSYILYYHMGVELNAILRGAVMEGLLIKISSCAAGIVAGAGIVSVVMEAVALFQNKVAVSVSADSLIKAILITGVLCIILVISGAAQVFLSLKMPKMKISRVKPIGIKVSSTGGGSDGKKGNPKRRNPQLLYVLRSLKKEKTTAILRAAFTMAVFTIITFCIKGIADANEEYSNADKKPDLIISRNSFVNSEGTGGWGYDSVRLDDREFFVDSRYFGGNLNVLEYITDDIIYNIKNIDGINKVDTQLIENNAILSYYSFEMYQKFVEENGIKALEDCAVSVKDNTYYMPVFPGTVDCTYYVKPTKKFYEKLSEYISEEYIDYNKFKEGGQLIIFNFTDETEIYNKTYKAGDTVQFPYSYLDMGGGRGIFVEENTLWGRLYNKFRILQASLESTDEGSTYIRKIKDDAYKNKKQYVTVAGVIHMDEEKKSEFYEKFPVLKEFPSRNVIIVSEELLKKIYNAHLSVFFKILGEEYPSDENVALSGNVLCVNYGLDSIYKATDNMLQAYLQKEGYFFVSNVEENNICRINYVNKILSYMITIIGLSIIYFLVIIIWNCFKFMEEKDKLVLYSELGAEKKKLSGIGVIRYGVEAGMAFLFGMIICCAALSYKYCAVYLFTAAVITLLCGASVWIIYARGLYRKER